jgi:cytosine/adenosine deaminase-related metal-dependent hydrolase
MADLIVAHGVVIAVDKDRRIIEDGAVAVTGDRIVDVGPSAEVLARHQAPKIIDASRKAVIPGLVDAHAHAGHGLIKTLGAGDSDAWNDACEVAYTVASTPDFWRAESRLAALERLRFGVTTGVSLLGGGDTILRTDDPAHGDAHCQGVVEVGTRSVVALGPTRPPHPRTYARWENGARTTYPVTFERQLATSRTLIDRWHATHGGRLSICLITPTLRDEHARDLSASDFAEAQRHAVETRRLSRERGLVFTQDGHRNGSVAFAHGLGLLGPDALLSHSTDLTDDEIRICADTDTKIAHNPSAIASIYGRCPAPELMAAGVTVALGSDATAPDRSADMFRHMQQFMHYHRRHFRDSTILPPGRTLETCTIDGARALGMEKDIGSLEIGKKADITLVDLARPHMYPLNMPLFRVVCFANGNDVHTVIVDGKVVLDARVATLVDEEEILADAQRETDLLLDRGGLRGLIDTPASAWSR